MNYKNLIPNGKILKNGDIETKMFLFNLMETLRLKCFLLIQ